MRTKRNKHDIAYSLYIRTRDNWTCQRCGKKYPEKTSSLQNSHYVGRSVYALRFFDDNCDALCMGCHQMWGSTDREAYRDFKIKQLGRRKFNKMLTRRFFITNNDRRGKKRYWLTKERFDEIQKKIRDAELT